MYVVTHPSAVLLNRTVHLVVLDQGSSTKYKPVPLVEECLTAAEAEQAVTSVSKKTGDSRVAYHVAVIQGLRKDIHVPIITIRYLSFSDFERLNNSYDLIQFAVDQWAKLEAATIEAEQAAQQTHAGH